MNQKQVQMMASLNKNTFCSVRGLAPFCIETTLARIDFLRRVGDWWAKKALTMLKNRLKILQNKSASSFFVDGVSGCKPIGAETGISGEVVDVVFKHRGKGSRGCKPLYEMGTADALNSLMKARCVLYRTHVYKKKSPSGMANHATGRDA